jgi:hypothetical protein
MISIQPNFDSPPGIFVERVTMIEDADRPDGDAQRTAANDNGRNAEEAIDPRILVIARAIGRLMRESSSRQRTTTVPTGNYVR